jgi:hypothetical protein
LEAELNDQSGKTDQEVQRKRERVLTKWLGLPQKFKSPGSAPKRET